LALRADWGCYLVGKLNTEVLLRPPPWLWDAKDTSPNWNAVEVGPKRDVLTELYNASVEASLPFGIYYSQGKSFDLALP